MGAHYCDLSPGAQRQERVVVAEEDKALRSCLLDEQLCSRGVDRIQSELRVLLRPGIVKEA